MPPPTKERRERVAEGMGSRSSSRIAYRRSSIVSTASTADRMETDEQRKRKREDHSANDTGKSNLRRIREIGTNLREYMYDTKNLVGKGTCKYVQECVCDLENLMLEILMENEKLKGMIENKPVGNSGVNAGMNVGGKGISYASVTASITRPAAKVSMSDRHAVVMRPKDPNLTNEVVKEKVLKDIQPSIKVRVNAVRMLRSGGIAIEAASQSELEQIKKSNLFERAGLSMTAPRRIGLKLIIFDVPTGMATKDLMAGIYERNLREVVSEAEM